MEHSVTIDIRAPLAFDRTPLSIALEGVRGLRTPFSPERTDVLLPDTNPEEEESLAGALGRQGATLLLILLLRSVFVSVGHSRLRRIPKNSVKEEPFGTTFYRLYAPFSHPNDNVKGLNAAVVSGSFLYPNRKSTPR